MSASEEAEFAPEYSRAERIRMALWAVLGGGIAIAIVKLWLVPAISAFGINALCTDVFGYDGITVLFYGLFVGMPFLLGVLVVAILGTRGYKILRDGQAPYFGEKVLRPTRIQRGRKAKLNGALHFAACVPMLLLSLWGVPEVDRFIKASKTKPVKCTANLLVQETARGSF